MRHLWKGLLAALLVLSLTACPNAVVPNRTPTGASAAATQLTLIIGESITLSAEATDPDGDDLTYTWSVSDGSLSAISGQSVTYTASDSPGTVSVVVTISDGSGNSTQAALTLTVAISNQAVSGFLATAKGYSVDLAWTNPTASNFANVMIRRSESDYPSLITQGTLVYEGTNTFFLDEGLSAGTQYFYSIWAKNNSNEYSDRLTASSTPFVPDSTPPFDVTGLEADPGDSNISLSWTETSVADLDYHEVTFIPVQSGINQPLRVNAGTPGVLIQGLVNTVEYTFTVKAVDTSGNKSFGVSTTGTPQRSGGIDDTDQTPPPNVTAVGTTAGDNQVTINWTDPTVSDYAYAEITFSPTQAEVPQPVVVPRGAGTVTINPLRGGTAFAFTIKSVDFNGNKSTGVTASALVADTTPPGQVGALSFTPIDNTSGWLTWTNPSDFDYQHSRIELDKIRNTQFRWYTAETTTGSSSNPLSTAVTSLYIYNLRGLDYTVTIETEDYNNNFSDPVTYTFTPVDTTAPLAANVWANPDSSGGIVNFTWTNDEPDEAGISVTFTPAVDGIEQPVVSEEGVTEMSIEGLDNGTLYTFDVQGFDYAGNLSPVTTVTATPEDVAPARPTGAAVATTYDDLSEFSPYWDLTWTDPDDDDLDRIEISFTPAITGVEQPVEVAPGIETYRLDGVALNTAYDFVFQAYDEGGSASSTYNIYSQVISNAVPGLVAFTAANVPTGSVADLSWTDPTIADLDHLEFTIEPDVAGVSEPIVVEPGLGSHQIEGLTNGTEYSIAMTVVDIAGQSSTAYTRTLVCQDIPPTKPAALTATPDRDGEKVTLEWTNPTESDFDHVEITFAPTVDTITQPYLVDAEDDPTITFEGLTNDIPYAFFLRSVDSQGNKSDQSTVNVTPSNPAPSAVSDVEVTADYSVGGNAILSWTEPTDSDFTKVEITFTPTVVGITQPIIVPAGTTSHSITGLTDGEYYAFSLGAGDATDNFSGDVETTPFVPWDTSGGIYAPGVVGPGGGYIVYDKGSVSDGWQYLEALVDDSTTYPNYYSALATGTAMGTGLDNTEALVVNSPNTYAPRVVYNLIEGGQDDWFLPSVNELETLVASLYDHGIPTVADDGYCWTSTFSSGSNMYMGYINTSTGEYVTTGYGWQTSRRVIPFRRF